MRVASRCVVRFVPLALALAWPTAAVAVPKGKILKDFKSQYQVPEGRKVLKTKVLGKRRKFLLQEGLRKVPYLAHRVQVDNLFTDCGLKVRYTWEVWYRRSRQFTKIAIFDHKFLNAPKPPAPLAEADALNHIKNGWEKGQGHYTTKVTSVKLVKQTPGWNFCFPRWELEFTIQLTSGKSHETMHDFYECNARAMVTKKKDGFEVNTNTCIDPKTKKPTQCFYENHCKKLGQKSAVSALAWGDVAKRVVEKGVCDYIGGNTRSDCAFKKVKLLRAGKPSADMKKIWFKVDATVGFNESNRGRRERTDPWKVDSRYHCVVDVELEYSTSYEDKWAASTEMKWFKPDNPSVEKKYISNLAKLCTCLEPKAHCEAVLKN